MQTRYFTSLILCSITFFFTATSVVRGAEQQPNILYIMSDDHAAHSIGAYRGRLAVVNPTLPHWELYDLQKDPREMQNVIADPAYQSTLKKLKHQLSQLTEQTGDTDARFPELKKRRDAS